MYVVLGLVSFVLLLSCLVTLRERRLRRGWQKLLQHFLTERRRHAQTHDPPPRPHPDERM